tara:strand:+ start:2440 stop:2643 length:204 start_codon:yes stop_codon:yes gene_type:complete
MRINIDADYLAMTLAQKKLERKYEKLGETPYEEVYEEYVAVKYTQKALVDYQEFYDYYLKQILKDGI